MLSFGVLPDGQPDPCWWYRGGQPRYDTVPGSTDGAQVLLLTSWADALAALTSPGLRDLAAVSDDHALGGVTLQRPAGLLRRSDPGPRAALNPVWRPAETERYRPQIRALAGYQARRAFHGGGPADLITAFTEPYAQACIQLAAGLDEDQAGQLTASSDHTTGTVLPDPAAHAPVRLSWELLYADTARWVTAARSSPGASLVGQSVAALDAAGMPPGEVHETVTTVHNGLPTVRPALARVLGKLLDMPSVLAGCAGNAALTAAAVTGCLPDAAFTFALPGVVTTAAVLPGGTAVDPGTVVVPVMNAAHWDPARPRGRHLTWGGGIHRCLGRHLAVIILEEAVAAVAEWAPQPAGPHGWALGTMPVPRELPVTCGWAPGPRP